MPQGGSEGRGRYVAFISYSHRDAGIGRWLHRRLETYRIPRRLVGSEGEHGPVPERLTPIFRDRDELPAAGDLSEKVRAALAVSDNLIVVCSPNAAASPWVAKEIETFRALRPGRPVFAAIAEGEPAQCFPSALGEGGIEPLAADLRKQGDGRRLGVLKLVAGLAGIGLDALVQRDAQRHLRRVTAITLGAMAAMVVMAVLTILALSARAEAERQRAEAEGLVEFMLTDLRDRLRTVGRLDVLGTVNERAIAYYAAQGDPEDLPDDSLERRARVLHAIGEDDEKRGELDRALARFREAHDTTAVTLARHPQDPDAIFAHSQSEFWLGYIAYLRKNWPRTARHWRGYKMLADQLVSLDSSNPKWLREAALAQGNLCTLAVDMKADARTAVSACQAGLDSMKRVHAVLPEDQKTIQDLVNRHAWLGGALAAAGDKKGTLTALQAQERLLQPLLKRFPNDAHLQDQWMRTLMTTAEHLYGMGRASEAASYNERARAVAEKLTKHDPANVRWRKWIKRIEVLRRQMAQETVGA
jgi:tetratricopeptide (TPR) repeat protein